MPAEQPYIQRFIAVFVFCKVAAGADAREWIKFSGRSAVYTIGVFRHSLHKKGYKAPAPADFPEQKCFRIKFMGKDIYLSLFSQQLFAVTIQCFKLLFVQPRIFHIKRFHCFGNHL